MPGSPPGDLPDQAFPDAERLFRRVRRNNLRPDGRPTPLAFGLPDLSVNREQCGTEEDARKGYHAEDWGVVAFRVGDIPPRHSWVHLAQLDCLVPRHVPVPGNFAHAEVRVRRRVGESLVLITDRGPADFGESDPDRGEVRVAPGEWLDPDFHLRWRKHIALASKLVLPPAGPPAERGGTA